MRASAIISTFKQGADNGCETVALHILQSGEITLTPFVSILRISKEGDLNILSCDGLLMFTVAPEYVTNVELKY